MKRICVYCGSSRGNRPEYADAATALGDELLARGIGLVFGGGSVGLMGVIARRVVEGGGEVIGVIPKDLLEREVGYRELPDLRVVDSMHERKALMAQLAEGFVAMPGGIGTFEEVLEALTWSQLGIHPRPVGLFNVSGYYDPMVAMFDHAVAEGFFAAMMRETLIIESGAADLVDAFERFTPPPVRRWLGNDQI